ncbi:MAG: hypothetical protein IE935_04375 [Micrococcales bacterium]|nr:hypothetical protein [Micrococcales bacterium]
MNRRRPFRAASIAVAAVLGVGALAGCGPSDPAPTPTPTGFASEEEAFAAAEATYRAYVDALNQVDLSDPSTFEEVYRWTTGDANAGDREGLSQYHADRVTVTGDSVILLAEPGRPDPAGPWTLAVCLDVSAVEVTDAEGNSLVDPDRAPVQTLTISLEPAATTFGLAIESIGPREGEPRCES